MVRIRLYSLVALFTLCAALAFAGGGAESDEAGVGVNAETGLPDYAGRTIIAVTSNDYPPLSMVNPESGESIGFEYDMTNEIARRLNLAVDWRLTTWSSMIPAVQSGQFDVGMDGITITAERAEQVDFSESYLVSQQFMLVRADEERFATPEELGADDSLLIGALPGTTNFYVAVYDVLDGDESNPRIRLFDSFGAVVQALINGDIDTVLMDAASSRGYIGANPDSLKVVGDALGTEDFGFIFTPDSDLVDGFNAALAAMKEDGFLARLETYWFYEYNVE